MKIVASGAVLLLMFSIISFGMPTFVNAQSAEFPLTVSTDYPGYAENGEIIISGKVKESSLSEYATPITLMIINACLLYTSPSPRDLSTSRMPSSA